MRVPGKRTRRALAVVAVLFGLLLLQGSLCGGSGGTAVPCVGSCDRVDASIEMLSVDALRDGVTVAFSVPDSENTDHGGLVNLCVTVLLAVAALLVALARPAGLQVPVRPAPTGASWTRPSASHRPTLCALRI